MAWIEVHQSLPTHKKTLALCDALNITPAQAVGHLVCLWLWSLDNTPDGALLHVSNKTIARSAQWTKNADVFVLALADAGFLDKDGVIHDWPDYTWKLLDGRQENRSRNRERQQRWRNRQRDSNAVVTRDVTVMDNVTDNANNRATVPDPTGPNLTVPDLTKDPPLSPQGGKQRRVTVVDQDFRAEMIREYADAYGSGMAVASEIDQAMSHKARLKCTDERAYLRNWLRRGVPRGPGKPPLRVVEDCMCEYIRACDAKGAKNGPRQCPEHGYQGREAG